MKRTASMLAAAAVASLALAGTALSANGDSYTWTAILNRARVQTTDQARLTAATSIFTASFTQSHSGGRLSWSLLLGELPRRKAGFRMVITKGSDGRHVLAVLCGLCSARPSGTSRLKGDVAEAVARHSVSVRVEAAGWSLQGPISAALSLQLYPRGGSRSGHR